MSKKIITNPRQLYAHEIPTYRSQFQDSFASIALIMTDLSTMDKRLTTMEERQSRLEADMDHVKGELAAMRKIDENGVDRWERLEEKVDTIGIKMDRLVDWASKVNAEAGERAS
ncbi:MAG: hypothetical protein Q9167_006781 [Letrouitia subvulpina]